MAEDLYRLPERTVANLVPPGRDHPYFTGGVGHPFAPRATEFSLPNAGWLADASLLVYGAPDFIPARVAGSPATAGMRVRWFAGERTQCFVMHDERFAIAA